MAGSARRVSSACGPALLPLHSLPAGPLSDCSRTRPRICIYISTKLCHTYAPVHIIYYTCILTSIIYIHVCVIKRHRYDESRAVKTVGACARRPIYYYYIIIMRRMLLCAYLSLHSIMQRRCYFYDFFVLITRFGIHRRRWAVILNNNISTQNNLNANNKTKISYIFRCPIHQSARAEVCAKVLRLVCLMNKIYFA